MAKRSNKLLDDLDITKTELKQLGEAFKDKEFLKLFAEYADEVNDPKNKAIFESEVRQLEKERGNDLTFIHPKPGYVIKTSADGCQKAFINVCHNENIAKPSATRAEQNGTVGLNWSVPFTHVKGRVDFDKKRNYCLFFDVVFHPDTIHLAKKNAQFRQLVNDTALTAVEDVNGVKLDRKNLIFPKAAYKGPVQSSVVRKKIAKSSKKDKLNDDSDSDGNYDSSDEKDSNDNKPFDIPNYPYPKLDENQKPEIRVPRPNFSEENESRYTKPQYVIKERKGIDIQEYRNSVDAKLHAAIPSELVIEVELPLIRSAVTVVLDVVGKSLRLSCENPAKYKLDINLPYAVNEDNGTAKFEKDTKRLIVTLPVKRKEYNPSDFLREDSGIESDQNHTNRSSSEEDISKDIEIVSATTFIKAIENESSLDSETFRTSEEVQTLFLKPDCHYMFPPFTIYESNGVISATLDVKNVDPCSVAHQFLSDNKGMHISFASLGSGYFPVYYAFCFKISDHLDTSSLEVEVWDNNIVATVSVLKSDKFQLSTYFAGTDPNTLKEYNHTVSTTELLQNSEEPESKNNDVNPASVELSSKKTEDRPEETLLLQETLCVSKIPHSGSAPSVEQNEKSLPIPTTVTHGKDVDWENKESSCDEGILCSSPSDAEVIPDAVFELEKDGRSNNGSNKKKTAPSKTRTVSESSLISTESMTKRRSILKCSRSLSESHTDEYFNWSSIDSEDVSSTKKSVRFSDVVKQKIFRPNSSILGQRKKNEKRSRNRKKAQERRIHRNAESDAEESETFSEASEIEVSDISDLSTTDISESSDDNSAPPPLMESAKKHRRRGSKNRRKNAATAKQNYILHDD